MDFQDKLGHAECWCHLPQHLGGQACVILSRKHGDEDAQRYFYEQHTHAARAKQSLSFVQRSDLATPLLRLGGHRILPGFNFTSTLGLSD